MNTNHKQPTTWDDYERGGSHRGSIGSTDSHVHFDEESVSLLHPPGENGHNSPQGQNLRHRR